MTMIQAAPVPTAAARLPTLSARISELPRYRGRVVDHRCGQMFSAGFSAIHKSEAIGRTTIVAMTSAATDHSDGSRIRALGTLS